MDEYTILMIKKIPKIRRNSTLVYVPTYGSHNIIFYASDTSGNIGASNRIYFTIQVNHPPYPPSKPTGPTSGVTGTKYCYSSSTTDPDGDSITGYFWNWNDGWTSTSNCHTWYSAGIFRVTVKARDSKGAMSGPSPGLNVNITKPSCTCTEWIPALTCCGSRLRPMQSWTRSCNPPGCDIQSRCYGPCFV